MPSAPDLRHLHSLEALIRARGYTIRWNVDGRQHLKVIVRRPPLKTVIVSDIFDAWTPLYGSESLCKVLDRMALEALYELEPSTALIYRSACR